MSIIERSVVPQPTSTIAILPVFFFSSPWQRHADVGSDNTLMHSIPAIVAAFRVASLAAALKYAGTVTMHFLGV